VKRETLWAYLLDTVLNSYAIIFFARSRRLGLLLLLATFLAPYYGALGLLGVLVAFFTAEMLGFSRAEIRSGAYLFNSLLTSLAVAYLTQQHPLGYPLLALLLLAFSLLALFATVFLSALFARQWSLPSMSLPFVIVTLLLYLVFSAMHGWLGSSVVTPSYLLPEPAWFPAPVQGFFRACGAIFFLPHVLVGVVAVLCLLSFSRLTAIYAVLGYAVGCMVLQVCHTDTAFMPVAFNFVFCAIAIGGIFVIPSRGSLLLLLLGVCWCALIGVASTAWLHGLGLPPLALPFNLAVLSVLAALHLRSTPRLAYLTPFFPGTPEENYHRFNAEVRRFPDAFGLQLTLPFYGEWTVTQGVDDLLTHRGAWAHALDFEIVDTDGNRCAGDGNELSAYYAYLAPIVAPCHGTVVKVVTDVADNLVGSSNLDANWGNLVLLLTDTGAYVLLCHLAQWTVSVVEGERVVPGRLLGKCGNSGRSSVPHLHLQMQSAPLLGASTIPFILCQYIEHCGQDRRYHTSGLPTIGNRVRPVSFDEQMISCFDQVIYRQFRYRLRIATGEREEEISCAVDESGAYIFHSPACGATLSARVLHKVWYVLDYQEKRRSLLRFFWLGLSRCPLTSEDGLHWTERLDLAPLLHPLVRAAFDLCGPFIHYPETVVEHELSTYRGRVGGGEALARITTTVTLPRLLAFALSAAPRKIELILGPHHGILGGAALLSAGRVEMERLIDEEPEAPGV